MFFKLRIIKRTLIHLFINLSSCLFTYEEGTNLVFPSFFSFPSFLKSSSADLISYPCLLLFVPSLESTSITFSIFLEKVSKKLDIIHQEPVENCSKIVLLASKLAKAVLYRKKYNLNIKNFELLLILSLGVYISQKSDPYL